MSFPIRTQSMRPRVLLMRAIGMLSVSLAAAAAGLAALWAIALWAPQNEQAIRVHLAAAVADGTINTYASYGALSSQRQPYYILDCLIFGMMLAPSSGPIADAISNHNPWPDPADIVDPRVPLHHDCQGMVAALPEAHPPSGMAARFQEYDRYILGMKTLGRVMLSFMTVQTMKRVLLIGVYALLAVLIAAALHRFAAAGADIAARARAAGFVAIGVCLALFYGLEVFGGMLYFAPLEATHIVFILIALVVPLA